MTDVWVPEDDQRFFNLTRHLELVEAGLVPLDVSHNSCPVPWAAERRPKVASGNSGGIATLTKTALRKKLLETRTIPDRAWAAWREAKGIDASREKGESREAFIKRVLG